MVKCKAKWGHEVTGKLATAANLGWRDRVRRCWPRGPRRNLGWKLQPGWGQDNEAQQRLSHGADAAAEQGTEQVFLQAQPEPAEAAQRETWLAAPSAGRGPGSGMEETCPGPSTSSPSHPDLEDMGSNLSVVCDNFGSGRQG